MIADLHQRATLALLFVFLLGAPPSAKPSAVVKTSKGTVEFIGLEKWTPESIEEKLGYKSTDQLHYCAVDLKKIGFPEAAVIGYMNHGRRYSVVTVIEPEYAKDVAFLAAPRQKMSAPPTWNQILSAVQRPDFLDGGVLDYARTLPGAKRDLPPLSDGTPQTWWSALRKLSTSLDYKLARRMLQGDADPSARAAAALVLMNFSQQDETWRDLVRGLRDQDDKVNSTCLQALNSLATFLPRKIDWAPAVTDIVALMRGTNLFALEFVLKTLTATHLNQDLAAPLLSNGNARLVLDYLNAQHPEENQLARRFLTQLHGSDLGDSSPPWRHWIASIEQAR